MVESEKVLAAAFGEIEAGNNATKGTSLSMRARHDAKKKLLKPQIALVEDDKALSAESTNICHQTANVSCFESAEAFEDYVSNLISVNTISQTGPRHCATRHGLKGMSGISFFHRLNDNYPHFYWPICFITGL